MKARPILMSSPMVRALLEGRKTQTRRILKANTPKDIKYVEIHADEVWFFVWGFARPFAKIKCPFGKPGDLLWVRENFSYLANEDYIPVEPKKVLYAATDQYEGSTKPSIHMPKWASRLTLEITEIRVERLKQISETDANAEGCPGQITDGIIFPSEQYAELWESINGSGTWDKNPWVWVISFKVHHKNIDEFLSIAKES